MDKEEQFSENIKKKIPKWMYIIIIMTLVKDIFITHFSSIIIISLLSRYVNHNFIWFILLWLFVKSLRIYILRELDVDVSITVLDKQITFLGRPGL